jgi:mannose-6-phosphate isomerase
MTDASLGGDATWRTAVRGPLHLPPNPVFRGYRGGDRLRRFRGMPPRGDDNWPEEWVGSTTPAGNPDPEGRVQGLSMVETLGGHRAPLLDVVAAFPAEMLGEDAGDVPGVPFLVKIIALAGMGPMHAHPDAAFTRAHLDRPHGKAEAWLLLDATPGTPGWAGIGFRPGSGQAAVRAAITERSTERLREMLHRTDVAPGDAWFLRPGVPHYLGPDVMFIEIQEPADLSVVPEHWTVGADEAGATMGLGWDVGLTALDYAAHDREAILAEARQLPELIEEMGESRVWGLMGPAARRFFDVQRLDVADVLPVAPGRFGVCIVTAGTGTVEGDWGRHEIRAGDTFALPAAAEARFVSGDAGLTIYRCLGPSR